MQDQLERSDRRQRLESRARFDEIRQEISQRVRGVCRGMSARDCDELLSRMARVQLKYEMALLPETW